MVCIEGDWVPTKPHWLNIDGEYRRSKWVDYTVVREQVIQSQQEAPSPQKTILQHLMELNHSTTVRKGNNPLGKRKRTPQQGAKVTIDEVYNKVRCFSVYGGEGEETSGAKTWRACPPSYTRQKLKRSKRYTLGQIARRAEAVSAWQLHYL
jgi:hypothetical protein